MLTTRTTPVRRALRKRVPLEDGGDGFTTVPDGHEVAEIEVSVDLEKIAKFYGSKAMSNKSGTSKYMDGLIVMKVVSRHREP